MSGARNRVQGQASRQQALRATQAALGTMQARSAQDHALIAHVHVLGVDGLPRRLAARVRTLRTAVKMTAGVIGRAVQRGTMHWLRMSKASVNRPAIRPKRRQGSHSEPPASRCSASAPTADRATRTTACTPSVPNIPAER